MDGSKFMGYPYRDHLQRVKTFFEQKNGVETFLNEKKRGDKVFFETEKGGEDEFLPKPSPCIRYILTSLLLVTLKYAAFWKYIFFY